MLDLGLEEGLSKTIGSKTAEEQKKGLNSCVITCGRTGEEVGTFLN